MRTEFTYVDPYENELHAYLWETQAPNPKGIVMIIHGAGEHCGRYDHFASFLNEHGFHVIGNDHLGHGKNAVDDDAIYFSSSIGFHKVYEGVKTLRDYIQEHYPKLPVIMFAHSMGSFIGRYAMLYDQNRYDMAIFSGTALFDPTKLWFAKLVASIITKVKGDKYVSEWFNHRLMDGHIRDLQHKGIINKRIEWISSDPKVQRAVLEDPLCNKPFTIGAQKDILSFIPEIQDKERIKETASAAAIYFICGEVDPLGNYGDDIKKLYDMYRECGYSNVKYTVFNNSRHELLNEVEQQRHYDRILTWIERNLV